MMGKPSKKIYHSALVKSNTLSTTISDLLDHSGMRQNSTYRISNAFKRFVGWWEVGAVIASLISLGLIVAILSTMNYESRVAWKLPIQPNSLVAIFSTIAKSALLIPLAEGLSQLKWNHYEERAGTLDHLQAFDDASRGPWGALMFLFKMMRRRFSFLATAGALLTILTLVFEPFTQQIIDFPSRYVVLANETTSIMVADGWKSALDSSGDATQSTRFAFRLGLLSALANRTSLVMPEFSCSTLECRLPGFSSLAACPECENGPVVLDDNSMECKYSLPSAVNGSMTTFNNLRDFKESVHEARGKTYSNASTTCSSNHGDYPAANFTIFNNDTELLQQFSVNTFYGEKLDLYESIVITNLTGLRVTSSFPPYSELDGWNGMRAESTYCHLNFCTHQYDQVVIKKGNIMSATDVKFPVEFVPTPWSADYPYLLACSYNACVGPSFQIHKDSRIALTKMVGKLVNEVMATEFTSDYLANSTHHLHGTTWHCCERLHA
ncbi:hypothetical protein K469DRAFT_639609 [Zopfia rhizophila CBS 207.26]|uniref:Uncharacterized protein n=1 Tax=Zopfia rhizophila CBS 207.26 TaxID=1314779 RepID=A0A6A6DQY0_9PEZI|nr:hypothetical protein K469DRAFT_639609 [Zopfia rhizophila CBS 207.26]